MAQDHFERLSRHNGIVDWNFNVIYSDQPSVATMAERYRELLTKPEFHEPIPTQWLHATILRIGTTDQYTETEMLEVASKVQERVNHLRLPEFHFGNHLSLHGNVCFAIEPAAELEKLYDAVTQSLEEVVGPARATKSPFGHFVAHTSLAYTKNRENEEETTAMLNTAHIEPAHFRIHHMPLIRQHPTNGHYEWEIVKDIVVE